MLLIKIRNSGAVLLTVETSWLLSLESLYMEKRGEMGQKLEVGYTALFVFLQFVAFMKFYLHFRYSFYDD